MFSVDGLVSGLDTSSIIEGALALQQSRLDRLAVRKQEITEEQTAFKTIEAQLLGLQGSLGRILRSSNNAFDGKTAISSDEEAVAVSASSSAAAGTYKLRVTQLAQAHQIKSNEFSSRSDKIGPGTIQVQVGNRAAATIIITDSNNTLQGLVDSINLQSDDVTAAVIDDGSNSDKPLRLLMTSRHTGSENEIQIGNSLGSKPNRGNPDEVLAELDFTGVAVQEALDAQVQIGSGEGAITVSSSTNQFKTLFDGITFDAFRADPDKQIQITVEEDTAQVTEAIEGFVESYNSVLEFIDTNSGFDPETNTGGLLLGNRSAASVLSNLRDALSTVVVGVNENLRTLSSVGISTDRTGKRLVLDRSRLGDILGGRVDGVGLDDIRRLFAIDGQSDNPGVEFVLGTNKTQASPWDPESKTLIPYEVEINAVASSALLEATSSLSKNTAINDRNNTLEIEVDKTAISIRIPEGDYTPKELAKQIQTLINTAPDRAGREIAARISDDRLQIQALSVGRSSSIRIQSGSANAPLGLQEGQSDSGTDVAGVFRVKLPGQAETITEQASGNGRLLTSDPDNKYTAQLRVRSNLDESLIGAPTDAHLTVTRGIGAALDAAIGELLDRKESSKGELSSVQDRLNVQIESIDDDIERVEARMEARRESLVREFAALESTLAELQSVGTALSSGLSSSLRL